MWTVLLVDDSPVARRVVALRLAAEGFEVHEVSSARDARQADTEALTCAIIDLQLGDGNGTDLAAALLLRRASLPIAFFTAEAPASLIEQARARGPLFHKPDVDGLVAWAKSTCQPPPTK